MPNRFQHLSEQRSCLTLTHQLLDQPSIEGVLACLNQHAQTLEMPYRILLVLHRPNGELCCYRQSDDETCRIEKNQELLENGPFRLIQTTQSPLTLTQSDFKRRYQQLSERLSAPFSHYIGLPILNHQRLLGICEVLRHDNAPFSADETAYLELICESLGIALEHLQARTALRYEQDQLCEERDDFHVLVNVTNAVLAQLDLEDVIDRIAQEIHRYFSISAVSIVLPDKNDDYLNLYHRNFAKGTSNKITHQHILARQSLCSRVLQSGKCEQIELAAHDPMAKGEALIFGQWPQETHTIHLLPLTFAGKVRGVLKLAQAENDSFSSGHQHLLEQIAERTAIAVDNARAYHEINRLKDNLMHENRYLSQQVQTLSHSQFDEIIGRSASITDVLQQIEIVANTNCSVLLLGETGTGKELFARAIHRLSPRSNKQMIKMNCAAMPAGLLESDLFGHEKGAFTGASKDREGRFELAHKSSLFLDEVGDMPLELQPKLLRVLQEQEFERVGGSKLIKVDVRLIAATNRDLKQMVEDKEFRSDLFYRLNVFPIRLPPLRERVEDIPSLVKFFVFRACQQLGRSIDSIPASVIQSLQTMPWPGNVRELQNVIERAVLLSRDGVLQLPPELGGHTFIPAQEPILDLKPHHDSADEYQRIVQVLQETNGIVAGPRGAAQKLGLKRTTLLSRMKRLGIDKNAVLMNIDEA
ncbi:sigma 54-interacting transcriptional regulator [Celerinatantimonas sp. YJH-8]|uniref:sigma 54-interacting transcriptional regulator n=1 Tax=Celerinatantimonas sp. YJH-8 TaxID=3228714 RepID=UPI0038BE5434